MTDNPIHLHVHLNKICLDAMNSHNSFNMNNIHVHLITLLKLSQFQLYKSNRTTQPPPQPPPQPSPQPAPQTAPQPAPQPAPEPAPEPTLQPASQPASQSNCHFTYKAILTNTGHSIS